MPTPKTPKSDKARAATAKPLRAAPGSAAMTAAMREASRIETRARKAGNVELERDAAGAVGALSQLVWQLDRQPSGGDRAQLITRYDAARNAIYQHECFAVDRINKLRRQIGAELREHREQSGTSLRELARRAKLSAPFICDVERGNRMASRELVKLYQSLRPN